MSKNLSRSLLAASLAATIAAPVTAQADSMAIVKNGNDSGKGSLRAALASGATTIKIRKRVGTINILSTLEYAGEAPLTIKGKGQTVSAAGNFTLLAATSGADLSISNLDFAGPGGFDINNRGDVGQDAGKGIFIDVADDATGTISLSLRNVAVSGVANHGIHVSDCSLADDCGGGSGGGGEGSTASVMIELVNVTVDDVGNGKFDADGLRVDERGDGDIIAHIFGSSFTNVGADGVELDEGNDGSIYSLAKFSDFSNNGAYCSPSVIEAFIPDPDEGEFAESDMVLESDIPSAPYGSPDDRCIEREVSLYDPNDEGIEYVEEFEFGNDVDDGFDMDEAGEGDLISTVAFSTINDNFDEGMDLDEEDGGSIVANYVATAASGNTDDGYKHSEEDGGDNGGYVFFSSATDNGGKGFVYEEEGEGDLELIVIASQTANNDDSDDTGIEAVQEDAGIGSLKVRFSDIADGIDTDGVDEI